MNKRSFFKRTGALLFAGSTAKATEPLAIEKMPVKADPLLIQKMYTSCIVSRRGVSDADVLAAEYVDPVVLSTLKYLILRHGPIAGKLIEINVTLKDLHPMQADWLDKREGFR